MNCEDFEKLLADAVGGELNPADRPVFEAHLAACERCRRDCESMTEAVAAMRALPGPPRVIIKREGNRLVISDVPTRARFASGWRGSSLLRYAASVLIAFTAGFALHAGWGGGLPGPEPDRAVERSTQTFAQRRSDTFRTALVSAAARNPSGSNLANCMTALFGGG